jgi:hypothetical protein
MLRVFCDVHLCSLPSALPKFTINMQLYTLLQNAANDVLLRPSQAESDVFSNGSGGGGGGGSDNDNNRSIERLLIPPPAAELPPPPTSTPQQTLAATAEASKREVRCATQCDTISRCIFYVVQR